MKEDLVLHIIQRNNCLFLCVFFHTALSMSSDMKKTSCASTLNPSPFKMSSLVLVLEWYNNLISDELEGYTATFAEERDRFVNSNTSGEWTLFNWSDELYIGFFHIPMKAKSKVLLHYYLREWVEVNRAEVLQLGDRDFFNIDKEAFCRALIKLRKTAKFRDFLREQTNRMTSSRRNVPGTASQSQTLAGPPSSAAQVSGATPCSSTWWQATNVMVKLCVALETPDAACWCQVCYSSNDVLNCNGLRCAVCISVDYVSKRPIAPTR